MMIEGAYDAPTADDRRMWDLWLSGLHQPAIVAADEAGIFTALAESPATIPELARRLDFDERATSILVRLLAALRLLRRGSAAISSPARRTPTWSSRVPRTGCRC